MAYDGTLKFDTSMDTSGFQKDANSLGNIVKGLGVFKIIEQGFQAITASIDKAVSRYDTLNRFPKIMEQMSFSADETDTAMRRLSDGVQGLPTALDAITGAAQRIASMTGDLVGAADLTLALNNAFLASGASADTASRGMEQYMQIISRGRPEMEDWKTLQETMPYALQKVAESFGFAGTSATRDFYAALQSGEITVEQMNARFIELSTTTGGFADTAKTATGGIGTAWQNLKTGMIRGVANIVESIDTGLSKTRFKSIENVIQSAGKGIEAVLNALAKAFERVAENSETLIPIITALAGAFLALKVKAALTSVFKALSAAFAMASAQAAALAAGSSAAASAMVFQTGAQKALTIAVAAGNVIKAAAVTVMGLFTGSSVVATGATLTLGSALHALGAAIYAALGPFGLILAAIVAVVAVVAALIALFDTSSAAYKREKEALKELKEEHEGYADALADSKDAADAEAQEKIAQAQYNRDLLNSLAALVDENGKLNGSSEEVRSTVSELTKSIEGLGLSFDETTGQINMSADELAAYGANLEAVTKYEAAQDEYNNILAERNSLQAKINTLEEKKAFFNQLVEEGSMSQDEANKLIEEADELLDDYGESMVSLEADVKYYQSAVQNAYSAEAEIAVRRQEIINNQSNDVKQLAHQYGASFDEIVDEASKMEGGLEQWKNGLSSKFTEAGQSLQGLANQWGMTTDEVLAYMDKWGMDLDEFAQHMEDTHTKEGLSLDDLAAKWGTTAEAIKLEMDNMGLSMQEWSDQQQAEWEEYEEAVKARTEGVVNSFKEIPGEYDKSAQEMLEILINNKTRYAEWETAMEEITKQLGPTAAAEFAKLGPEATSAMQEILGSAELLDQYRETFGVKIDEATGLAVENWNDPSFVGAPSTAIDTSAQQVAENTALTDAVTDAANSVVSGFRPMIGGAEGVAEDMMDGIGCAMDRKAPSLYAKAREIANRIAGIMAEALDVNSPSRVMIRLFENVMMGIYVGMDGMSGMLYREAESIADGITERLTISPDVANGFVERMRAVTDHTPLGGTTLVPQAAYAGGGGGTSYVTSLTQNITTPKPLSASEMTREGQDLLRRSRWQLP